MTALLRPSSAHRWANCPGSYTLEQVYPDDEESPEAREGTAAHYYVTEALDGRFHPVGTLAPNGHPIDADMVDNGQVYLTYVWEQLAKSSPTAAVLIEKRLTAHGLIHELCEGTPDTAIIDAAGHRIVIPDYKYGHRDVDPFENEQGINYIAMALEAYELTREETKGWEIFFAVVQPRNFRAEPVREWRLIGWQAWDRIEAMSAKAAAAVTVGALCQTGDHCRDCPAIHGCDAAIRMGKIAMDVAATSTPAEMSPEIMGRYLTHLRTAKKRIEAMTTALEEVAISKIRSGARVPGWGIGHGDAREKWTKPAAEVFTLGDIMGVELRKPQEPITPAQARKAGVDATVIKAYAEQPRGAAKLMPVNETSAAKAFGQ